jgi:N-acetylneuraminate synthase
LQKGQISCRELMTGEVLLKPCAKGQPLLIDMLDTPYGNNESLKKVIFERGI